MKSAYRFPAHVHACALDEGAILLDAKADKYLYFNSHQAAWLAELSETRETAREPSSKAIRFAERLERKDLLTIDPSKGKAVAYTDTPGARTSLLEASVDNGAVTFGAVMRFLAALNACRSHRKGGQMTIADSVILAQGWKSRAARKDASGDVFRLAGSFHRLSPYFVSTYNACFFRSLLLLHFLSAYGISADWVFGVRLAPFDAHCWVAYEDALLNETCDKAAEYKVIMVI